MPSIIVRGKNQDLIGQREQLAHYRIVLNARIAAREIGAPGAVDEQYIASKDAILRDQAYRIRSMARSVEDAKFLVAYFQDLTIFDVDAHVRSRRQAMHSDRRTGKLAQLYGAAPMIGMSVGVNDQIQMPP